MSSSNRPLSPHLQVYKPQLTSMMSIAHRLTGIALAFGLVVFTGWLYFVVTDASIADRVSQFFSSGLGVFMLYAWVFTFNYIYVMACDIYSGMLAKAMIFQWYISQVCWL